MLSTLAISGGCALPQDNEPEETVAEGISAVSAHNSVQLNGGGENGGGENGGGENGGGENGGGENGGGENGGGENGGGENGGGENGTAANLVGRVFDLKTITSITKNGASLQSSQKMAVVGLLGGSGQGANSSPFIGVEVTGKLDDNSTVTLRLDALEVFTSAAGDTLPRFVISYTRPGSDVRAHVCGLRNDAPIKTIPITGKWNYGQSTPGGGSKIEDPTVITFACQGYALYKCMDYGYPPWKHVNGVKLNKHHQACTRMIRADYCGDGRSWTIDGTIINLYDHLGIQADTESWAIEAEWDIDGARCLSHQRIQNLNTVPSCSFERSPSACGNPPQWGSTLLVSEAP